MAIQVSGTQVIGNSRELTNITSVDTTTKNSIIAAGVGDIQGVTAGTGLSGGGTSGTVTLNGTTHSQATWEAGTSTTEAVVSPAKVKAAIDALAGGGFSYDAVSGATQALDVGSHNFFDAGTLTADTTVSFSNVPTEARWTYTAEVGVISAWDLTAASYVRGFSVSTQDTSPTGLFFKPDGTVMYIVGDAGNAVYEYSLSTAWNVSTASYVRSYSVAALTQRPQGVFFKPDGTVMYIVGADYRAVYEYSLSTAWDISTASYVRNFSVAAQETFPAGLFFKPDGTAMYIAGNAGDDVNEYSLSTAWNVSTASYVRRYSVSFEEFEPQGVFFKPDGLAMYVTGSSGDDVNEYSLSTAWNVSTASYVRNFSVSTQDTIPIGLFFKPDGTVMYIVGSSGDAVYEYSTGTLTTLTIPTSVQNPPSASYLAGQQASYTFFTADGGTTVKLINEEVL